MSTTQWLVGEAPLASLINTTTFFPTQMNTLDSKEDRSEQVFPYITTVK